MELHRAPVITLAQLADFERLARGPLDPATVRQLLRHPQFFRSPKDHDQTNRQHARLVDRILGFEVHEVENHLVLQGRALLPSGSYEYWGPALHEGAQTWVGLDPQTLNTPYAVLLRLCTELRIKSERVVDLGASYGRLGAVLHQCAPRAEFLGLEYVPERVDEANRVFQRWGMRQARCEVQDLFADSFEMPEAEIYFIYDYGQVSHINATLAQLRAMSERRAILIVARGGVTNRLIQTQHPWLEAEFEGSLAENFRVYRS